MKTLFFTVAGLTIKLNFHPAEGKFFSDKLKSDIIRHYAPFITKKHKSRIDYSVHFYQKNTGEIFNKTSGKSNKLFIDFCRIVDKRTIISYYKISLHQFQFIILNILQKYLLMHGGFIFHASGNLFQKKALLFVGRPGAGKSTAMSLLQEKYLPIADDSVIIKKEGKSLVCYQTPFIENNDWVKRKMPPLKIGVIFLLQKSRNYKIKEIKDPEYLIERLSKQIWLGAELSGKTMDKLLDFVKKNKFYFLYFGKDRKKLLKLLEKETI